jgi:Ankyrin repeats (3 copies)
MNEDPPLRGDPEDVDQQYRRAASLDGSRPSESVGRSILKQAARVAADRAPRSAPAMVDLTRPAANQSRWRPAIVGTLAAAALAGLLITPRFFSPREPSSGAITQDVALEGQRERAPAAPTPPVPAAVERAAKPAAPPQSDARVRLNASSSGQLVKQDPRPEAQNANASRAAAPRASVTEVAKAADGTARDATGRSALMTATVRGQLNIVEQLLAAGADPNAADADGVTPLQAALAGHQAQIAAALRRAGAQ